MTVTDNKTHTSTTNSTKLVTVYDMGKQNVRFYMNPLGHIYWGYKGAMPKGLERLPINLQTPFMLKAIQNEVLAERIKFIQDPLVFIELYIKARFIFNTDLNISASAT